MKIFNDKFTKTLGRIFVPPMFEIKSQLIDTYNKILAHRCLYMEDIIINNVIELGQFVCLSVRLFSIISETA